MNEPSKDGPFTSSTHSAPEEAPQNNFAGRNDAVRAVAADPSAADPTADANPSAQLLASVVPAALIFGGVSGCAVLWLISNGNLIMRVAGIIVLLSDLVVAAILRHVFLKRLNAPRKPVD